MTSRQARNERREAERKAAKLAWKAAKSAPPQIGFVPQNNPPVAPNKVTEPVGFVPHDAAKAAKRAETNRANALHSTGPRSAEGKLASSRNSLKHGLASGEMIIPGESPAALEALLHDLLKEHQPANATEELLVTEMAQSWWLTQRAIRFQNECFTETGVDEKRLSLFLRYQTTHERAFHKALNTLTRLKQSRARQQAVGFVSQPALESANEPEFVRQNAAIQEEETPLQHKSRAA